MVLHTPGTYQALAFSARLEGDVLTFEETAQGEVVDTTSGSRWAVTGRATSGPLAGKHLTYLPSGVEEWYIWAAYHPETDIIGADEVLQTGSADQPGTVAHDDH